MWQLFDDGEKIGLDSPVFIYYLNRQAPYFSLCRELLRRIETGSLRGVISVVSEMEMLAMPGVTGRAALLNDVEQVLRRLTHLEIVEVDRTVARRAAQVHAEARVKGLDALIAATALSAGCRHLVGNDREFARRVPDLRYLMLDDYV